MQSSTPVFDIPFFKSYMDEAPTKENGWILAHEGPVEKKTPESTLKVYKKLVEGEPTVTIKTEGYFKGVKAENLFTMFKDISYREKLGHKPKVIKVVEQINKNSDVIYVELDLPFPMTNRDMVQKRLYLGNKEDADLVRELGLYQKDHKYYAVLVQSTERPEYPAKSKPIRAEIKIQFVLIEEDPKDPESTRISMVMCQKMNGDVPNMLINKISTKMPVGMMTGFVELYRKTFN